MEIVWVVIVHLFGGGTKKERRDREMNIGSKVMFTNPMLKYEPSLLNQIFTVEAFDGDRIWVRNKFGGNNYFLIGELSELKECLEK